MAKSGNTRHYYTKGRHSIRALVEEVLQSVPNSENNDKLLTVCVQYTALVRDKKIKKSKMIEAFLRTLSTEVVPSHTSIREARRELEADYPPTDPAVAENRLSHQIGALESGSRTCQLCGDLIERSRSGLRRKSGGESVARDMNVEPAGSGQCFEIPDTVSLDRDDDPMGLAPPLAA